MMVFVMMKRRLLASTGCINQPLVIPVVGCLSRRKSHGNAPACHCHCHCHLHSCAERLISEPNNVVRGRRHLAGCKEFQKSKFLGTCNLIWKERASLDTFLSPSRWQQYRRPSINATSPHLTSRPQVASGSWHGMNHRVRVTKKPIFSYITFDANYIVMYLQYRYILTLSVPPVDLPL